VPPEDEEKLCEYHKEIYTLYEQYKSEEQYREDIVHGRDKLSQKWSFKSEPLRWSS
jgi:hypothetical protein